MILLFEKFKDRIIVIEGADGTGKDTVVNLLHRKIGNSTIVRFPNRDNLTGHLIDKILRKEEPFPNGCLFQSLQLANKIETLVDIEKQNFNPDLFIFCRYIESSLVYGAMDGLPLGFSEDINSILPEPLMTFILYGKNYGHNSEHYETIDIQNNVSEKYRELSYKYHWNMISNLGTPEEIVDEIIEKINHYKL